MSLPKVGCQLIVFGGQYNVENDIEKIADTLAAAGYDAIEGGPQDAARYRPILDARGLVYAGSHVALSSNPDWDKLADYVQAMGAADVSNSGLNKWGDLTLDDYKRSIEALNEAGAKLRARGIHFHYHNHAFEFDKVDGDKNGMDLLMEGLDPQACDLCVDVAWVQKGGEDPAEYVRKHQEHIGYLHFKDFDDEDWCELGRGQMDFGPIMQLLPSLSRVRWVVLEQDKSRNDAMDSVTESRRFLKEKFSY
jgi:sugar phosphate isomerase/epimerase